MKRSSSQSVDKQTKGETIPKRFAPKLWTNCLFDAIRDQSLIVSKDDSFTIIKDKYPKSRHHFLVLPSKSLKDSVQDLNPSDLQMLEEMTSKAKQMALKVEGNPEFKFGFHRFPSLKPLHLHVISQDFDSKYLKTKKHYNSFTTDFFIDTQTVIQSLKSNGRVEKIGRQEGEQLLKQDIICHFCRLKIDNIPKLKTHLLRHFPK